VGRRVVRRQVVAAVGRGEPPTAPEVARLHARVAPAVLMVVVVRVGRVPLDKPAAQRERAVVRAYPIAPAVRVAPMVVVVRVERVLRDKPAAQRERVRVRAIRVPQRPRAQPVRRGRDVVSVAVQTNV
jgi:hypothetical protein